MICLYIGNKVDATQDLGVLMNPYSPVSLPVKDIDYTRIVKVVGEANAELARYDGLLQGIVGANLFISPLTNQEAVLSSRIEGTQATLDDIYEFEAGVEKEEQKLWDIQEVINYRNALRLGQERLEHHVLSLSLIKEMHQVLLYDVRGADKLPGQFRPDQNWIGPQGSPIDQATFVPPDAVYLLDHLQNLEAYLSSSDEEALVQCAIVHAQFELIHPFKDGNGRIGRLLIPLFLFQRKRLVNPYFYLSTYLEAHRAEYYDKLSAISRQGDWTNWIEFFLRATYQQARSNYTKVRKLHELYEEMKIKISDTTHSQHAIRILDTLFEKPIFKVKDFAAHADIPPQTTALLLRNLRDEQIIQTLIEGRGRRAGVYIFNQVFDITEEELGW